MAYLESILLPFLPLSMIQILFAVEIRQDKGPL